MKSISVTVGTTPTLLVAPDDKNREIYLHVIGNTTVYVGGSTVTTGTGLATEKHTSPIPFFIPLNEALYGVVVTATEDVRVMTPDVD